MSGEVTVEIDLRSIISPLVRQLRESLATFTGEHPDVEICTVGLYGDGFHGWISIWLDTPQHSAAHVAEWQGRSPIGVDDLGTFCDNCPDFAFQVTEHEFADFPDFYEIAEDAGVSVRGLDGSVRRLDLDGGDEEMHEAIAAPLLRAVADELMPFSSLRRAQPFRVLLQFIAEDTFEVRTVA